jgi:carbon-monoxide dehydrogenase small subunit
MSNDLAINVIVNGKAYSNAVEPRMLLVHYLRDLLGLTGTHVGCDTSQCGSCTVLVDGLAVKSCTMFAAQADASSILTIEGLAKGDRLHPLQEGFWEMHGLQCGFCTPGMVMTLYALLRDNPSITDEQIRHGLAGNLCRCTGYENIVKAAKYGARKLKGEK